MRGDRRAQFELYQAYSKAMFNICRRMMGSREDAEDVLQNAFVDVYTKMHSFRGDSTLGAWIKRIVINQCINELKRRKMHFAEMTENIAEPIVEHYQPASDAAAVERIKGAIDQLPNGYRVVFNLYLMEGYDHKEIAQILEISEGASKSQYSRARRKLNEILLAKTKVG